MWQPALLQELAGLVLDIEWELLVPGWGSASWLSHPVQIINNNNNNNNINNNNNTMSPSKLKIRAWPALL